jgi:hypothetical protein
MSRSHENYPTTVTEKREYRELRERRKATAELREAFERQQYREERALRDYLVAKGEIE